MIYTSIFDDLSYVLILGVWSLLAELWRREEAALNVDRKDGIIIADVNEALTTGLQREMRAQNTSEQPIQTSLCVLDVADNMRAKIYSLCSRLDFRSVPDSISVEDRATIILIERYMDIKTGEIWREIASELEREGTRPVAYDREGIAEILNIHKIKCEQVCIEVQFTFLLYARCNNILTIKDDS